MDYKEKVIALLKSQELSKEQKEKLENIFPELKSEDKRIKEAIIATIHLYYGEPLEDEAKEMLAWLEKQGTPAKLSEEEQNRFAKCVLTSCALSFINYLDAHKYEGKMCVSNGEYEDIENAFHNAMWDRLHRYYCKYIEKQGEQKAVVIIPKFRIGDNIKTTNEEPLTITKIDEKGYWSEDLFICGFDEECIWDLVGHKPADKEPKFHEGDWVILTAGELSTTLQIVNVDTNKKLYWFNDSSYLPIVDEECLHIWTIKDAKNGDVLCLYYNNRKTFFIFKAIIGEGDYADILVHCCYTGKYQYLEPSFNGECRMHQISDGGYCLPADKEEQDILFQKMHEAGYMWNSESKQLLSLKAEPSGEQKPAWSEEDEQHIDSLLKRLEGLCRNEFERTRFAINEDENWLKSLKQRIGG